MLNRRCLVNPLTVALVGVFLAIAGPAWAGGGEIPECPKGEICDGFGDHLECYHIVGGSVPQEPVVLSNQFGKERAKVTKAQLLCVVTQKNVVRKGAVLKGPVLDHGRFLRDFMCYQITGAPPVGKEVTVRNQFEPKGTVLQVQSRQLLCVPTEKREVNAGDEACCSVFKSPGSVGVACTDVTAAACMDLGGEPQGPGTTCNKNPCEILY